ncbi:hypothetical protein L1049_027197 [Liquidambar formosana]|uniref:Protein kinase domain-containing protein n=1 Tax=Liquidambar formosana TaxID=63359 RepID=A0AAP0R3Y4_LIQFO
MTNSHFRCTCNLRDMITTSPDDPNYIDGLWGTTFLSPKLLTLLRDLRPENILISIGKDSFHAKISDMGICKQLLKTGCQLVLQVLEMWVGNLQSRFLIAHATSVPWIYSTWVVSSISVLVKEAILSVNLQIERPRASKVLLHPMFWNSNTRLSFLVDASDTLDVRSINPVILQDLEHNRISRDWTKEIDKTFYKSGIAFSLKQAIILCVRVLDSQEMSYINQGLRWFAKRLRIDEDGDVADEFFNEVLPETSSSLEGQHKPLPKFEVKYSTRPAKVRKQVMSLDGKIQQYVEYQGRLQWILWASTHWAFRMSSFSHLSLAKWALMVCLSNDPILNLDPADASSFLVFAVAMMEHVWHTVNKVFFEGAVVDP